MNTDVRAAPSRHVADGHVAVSPRTPLTCAQANADAVIVAQAATNTRE